MVESLKDPSQCVGDMTARGEADDMARLGFATDSRCVGGQSCPIQDCNRRATVTLSFVKPSGPDVERVEGEMDGNTYIPAHWRKTVMYGDCLQLSQQNTSQE